MKEIIDKISSYNIFNYLLPGILFVVLSKHLTAYNFIQEDTLIGAFLYYFIGMVVSRFGSIIIEPILKKTSFLKFADYKQFVIASKKDTKIELLSEVNNTYRTIISMLLLLLLLKLYNYLEVKFQIDLSISFLLLTVFIFIMFLFSYRKQTSYITKRIEANTDSNLA